MGSSGDLPKILELSGVAARIELGKIPVAPAVRALFPNNWLELATRGGEDYELLFTLSPDAFDRISTKAEEIGATISAIGEITPACQGNPLIMLIDLEGNVRLAESGASITSDRTTNCLNFANCLLY